MEELFYKRGNGREREGVLGIFFFCPHVESSAGGSKVG